MKRASKAFLKALSQSSCNHYWKLSKGFRVTCQKCGYRPKIFEGKNTEAPYLREFNRELMAWGCSKDESFKITLEFATLANLCLGYKDLKVNLELMYHEFPSWEAFHWCRKFDLKGLSPSQIQKKWLFELAQRNEKYPQKAPKNAWKP